MRPFTLEAEKLFKGTLQYYAWLYNRPVYTPYERLVAHREEYFTQVREQREAREEMRSLKKAQ